MYKERTILSIRLDKDVRPLTEFRARVADYIHEICLHGRPLLVTHRGRGVVVVIDVRDFEIMRERLETLEATADRPTERYQSPTAKGQSSVRNGDAGKPSRL